MLKLDIWNIVWTIVNILVLYAIFRKFLFQPVLKVIQDRENIIKNQIDNAQKVTDDANQLKADYEKKLEVAKDEADKIIVEARQRSEKERAKAIEATKQETQACSTSNDLSRPPGHDIFFLLLLWLHNGHLIHDQI